MSYQQMPWRLQRREPKPVLGLLTGLDLQQEDPNLLCHHPTLAEERYKLFSMKFLFFFFIFFFSLLLKELSSASQGDPHHQFLPGDPWRSPANRGFPWAKCSRATSHQHVEAVISCQRLSAALLEMRVTGKAAHSSPKTRMGSFSWRSASRSADSLPSVFITPLFHIKRLMAMLTLTQSCLAPKRNRCIFRIIRPCHLQGLFIVHVFWFIRS